MILALVSLSGMIPCKPRYIPVLVYTALAADELILSGTLYIVFVIGSFVPCIPQISRDLRTTGTVVKQVTPSFLPRVEHKLTDLQFGCQLLYGFWRSRQPYVVELRRLLCVSFSYSIYLSCALVPTGCPTGCELNQPPEPTGFEAPYPFLLLHVSILHTSH